MTDRKWRSEKVYRPRDQVQMFAEAISNGLPAAFDEGHGDQNVYFCGSWRRDAEQVGDLDVLVITPDGTFPSAFTCGIQHIDVQHEGPQIINADLHLWPDPNTPRIESIHVDFYACRREQCGGMLMFLTGPKALNIQQRAWAQKLGFTLSQYGLLDHDGNQIDDGTEEDIYQRLGLTWIPPQERQAYADVKPPGEAKEVASEVPSDSGSGTYTVKVMVVPNVDPSQWVKKCTCMGFKYNRDIPQTCKHIKRVMAAYAARKEGRP